LVIRGGENCDETIAFGGRAGHSGERDPVWGGGNAKSRSHRGVPDVALNAGTATAIYNTGRGSCGNGWEEVLGTSIAAPLMAGIVNAAGTFNTSSNAENTEIYITDLGSSDFTDITTGSCGTHNAEFGWDFCTGWGVTNGYVGK
jgi:kumamolisin